MKVYNTAKIAQNVERGSGINSPYINVGVFFILLLVLHQQINILIYICQKVFLVFQYR